MKQLHETTMIGLPLITKIRSREIVHPTHLAIMLAKFTPGFVVATTACLDKHADPDADTIRRELSGNVCRCGTYPHIFKAAEQAARERRR